MLPIVNPYRAEEERVNALDPFGKHKGKKGGGGNGCSRGTLLLVLVAIVCGTYYLHLHYFASLSKKPSMRGGNTYRSFSDSVKDFAVDMHHDLQELDERKNKKIDPIDLKKPTDPAMPRSGKVNTFSADSSPPKRKVIPKPAVTAPPVPPEKPKPLPSDTLDRLKFENMVANAVEDKVISLAEKTKEIVKQKPPPRTAPPTAAPTAAVTTKADPPAEPAQPIEKAKKVSTAAEKSAGPDHEPAPPREHVPLHNAPPEPVEELPLPPAAQQDKPAQSLLDEHPAARRDVSPEAPAPQEEEVDVPPPLAQEPEGNQQAEQQPPPVSGDADKEIAAQQPGGKDASAPTEGGKVQVEPVEPPKADGGALQGLVDKRRSEAAEVKVAAPDSNAAAGKEETDPQAPVGVLAPPAVTDAGRSKAGPAGAEAEAPVEHAPVVPVPPQQQLGPVLTEPGEKPDTAPTVGKEAPVQAVAEPQAQPVVAPKITKDANVAAAQLGQEAPLHTHLAAAPAAAAVDVEKTGAKEGAAAQQPAAAVATTAKEGATGFDLPPNLVQAPPSTTSVSAPATKTKIDFCAGHVDPFAGMPVDTFQPPAAADFESVTQWKSAVKTMMNKISKVKYGGSELRELIRTEVEALQVMRFKMFCQYA